MQIHLIKAFWGEALHTANYLQNRSPTKVVPANTTPYELWYGRKPNLSFLKIFGSKAHVLIPKELRRKLDSHSYEAIFLGYSEEAKAYRLMNSKTNRLIISRDVIFDEHTIPISKGKFTQENQSEQLFDPTIYKIVPTSKEHQNVPSPNLNLP